MRFLTTLNKIEEELVREIVKAQKAYLEAIAAKLASGRTLTPKTLQWKLKTAKERGGLLRRDLAVYYNQSFEKCLDQFLNMAAKDIGLKQVNFEAVPWDRFKILQDVGLRFMHNYSDDMYKKVRSQLYVSMLNGETYTEAWLRIKPFGNQWARPKVMVRDQMARVAQEAIVATYKSSGHSTDYLYDWVGPDDERTTEICDDRKKGNPYTYEQMKDMNPHPHIQCRHRWVAKKKSSYPVEVKSETSLPDRKANVEDVQQNLLPGKDKELQTHILEYEDKIRKRKTEKAVMFDTKGNVIIDKSGSKDSVAFDYNEVELMKKTGSVMTHNHPSSSSFSGADFKICNTLKGKMIRVASEFFDYELKLDENFNQVDKALGLFKKSKEKWIKKLSRRFIEKDKALADPKDKERLFDRFNHIVSHLSWKDVAKELKGITYQRWVR